jgi:hypothetical protein
MALCLDCNDREQRGPRTNDVPNPSDGRCRFCRRLAMTALEDQIKRPHGVEHLDHLELQLQPRSRP